MVYNSFLYNQNMNKVWAFIPVAFAIFALMISPVGISAYTAEPQACNIEKANPVRNKHCDGTSSSTQFTVCDADGGGEISAEELLDYANAETGDSYTPDYVMNNWMIVDQDGNGIDTRSELRNLNNIIDDLGFTCS